ncbi:MAG: hypothetical protein E2O88_11915 [Bacteroidetes bacterium]|nr:MAG: hypothetical protein E2O88_11915 [Bacteroidota bacterium]
MRKGHSRKIKFEGGEFTRTELKKKPISILVNLLVTEKNAADNFHQEWEMGQEVNRVAQKEAREAEEERDELQKILDNLETVIQFRLQTVFEHRDTSYDYDIGGVPRTQPKETPEEEKVLSKLLSMVTYKKSSDRLGSHF